MIEKACDLLDRLSVRAKRLRDRQFNIEERNHLTIGRAYDSNWAEYECVFTLSTGRTGTQTLATLLDLSPHIDAHHEPSPRLVEASLRAFLERGQSDWAEKWKFNVLAARDDFVLHSNRQGKIYVETANRLSHFAPAIREAFPDSKFLFVHRDPYAVVRSSMRRGAYQGPNMAWNFARIYPRAGDTYFEMWNRFSAAEKEAWRWKQVNNESISFLNSLPAHRRFELPSAALFSGEADVYDRLFSFFGVSTPPKRRIDSVLSKRLNAQAHYNGKSFHWTDGERARVRRIVQDTARKLGYDA